MALAVALVVVLPFLFSKWASAPLPDPDAERLKVKGRLARGTVSLIVGALLATNIKAIHAHPSQLVVGVGSIATVFALFYGAYALLKGATSVLQRLSTARRAPQGFSEWYGAAVVLAFALLLALACTTAALIGTFTNYVPALSKHNWYVSHTDFPRFFWFTVVAWWGFSVFSFSMTYAIFRIIWLNPPVKTMLRDKAAQRPYP